MKYLHSVRWQWRIANAQQRLDFHVTLLFDAFEYKEKGPRT